MHAEPAFFARPSSEPRQLAVAPRLASWNASDHPDQRRLVAALDHAVAALEPDLTGIVGPLALRLDVGLPPAVDLLREHDLDNYLLPLAHRLARSRSSLVTVWAAKQHAVESFARVAPASPAPVPAGLRVRLVTTASASTKAYKQQIADQLEELPPLAPGPVAVQLAFAVGPRRNWLNLWKPSIDALEQLLGRTIAARQWHPQDGRITELALHRIVIASLRDEVVIDVVARSLQAACAAGPPPPEQPLGTAT